MCMHACAGTIVHLEGVYTSKFECNYLSGVRPPRPHLNLLARAEPFGKSSTPRSETHPSLFLNSFSFFLLYILLIEERVTVSNDVSLSLSLFHSLPYTFSYTHVSSAPTPSLSFFVSYYTRKRVHILSIWRKRRRRRKPRERSRSGRRRDIRIPPREPRRKRTTDSRTPSRLRERPGRFRFPFPFRR